MWAALKQRLDCGELCPYGRPTLKDVGLWTKTGRLICNLLNCGGFTLVFFPDDLSAFASIQMHDQAPTNVQERIC
jgi:hypothetical protein